MAKASRKGTMRSKKAVRTSVTSTDAHGVKGTRAAVRGGPVRVPMKPIAIGLSFIAVVLIVAYAVAQASKGPGTGPVDWQKAELDDKTSVPGEIYVPPHPGQDGVLCITRDCITTMDDRLHVTQSIPICTQQQLDAKNYTNPLCYNSNPPTSGPHNPNPMPFKVLDNPAQAGNLVHNMEHGGVVIWYSTDDQNTIKQLRSLVDDALNQRHFVVMTKYTGMESDTIAVTAWTRMLKFPASDIDNQLKNITRFISENDRRFNPEGF